jgi:hypothetical protein
MRTTNCLLIVGLLVCGCQQAGPAPEASAKKPAADKSVAKAADDPAADPAKGDAKAAKPPGIHVALKAAPDGKLTAILLNGKSLRNFDVLRTAVAPLVAACNRASVTPKAHIVLGADVRNVDAQRVIGALTNDVLGKEYYRLVDEWELRVEGSPLVLNARSIGSNTSSADREMEPDDFEVIDERVVIPKE